MTERRPGEARERGQAKRAARGAHAQASDEEAVLELQELAGNRAVSGLLGEHGGPVPVPLPSAGIRVRDLLRGSRPGQLAIQRQLEAYGLEKIEDEKTAKAGVEGGGEAMLPYEAALKDEAALKYEGAVKQDEAALKYEGSLKEVAAPEKGEAALEYEGALEQDEAALKSEGALEKEAEWKAGPGPELELPEEEPAEKKW